MIQFEFVPLEENSMSLPKVNVAVKESGNKAAPYAVEVLCGSEDNLKIAKTLLTTSPGGGRFGSTVRWNEKSDGGQYTLTAEFKTADQAVAEILSLQSRTQQSRLIELFGVRAAQMGARDIVAAAAPAIP